MRGSFLTFCKESSQFAGIFGAFVSLCFAAPIRVIRVIRGVCENPNFLRKGCQNFTQYISERREMNSQRQEINEGQNNERKIQKP